MGADPLAIRGATMIVQIISTMIILSYAVWSCLSKKVDDGLIGKLIYGLIALTALASMIHLLDGISNNNLSLIACVALLCVRNFSVVSLMPRVKTFLKNKLCGCQK